MVQSDGVMECPKVSFVPLNAQLLSRKDRSFKSKYLSAETKVPTFPCQVVGFLGRNWGRPNDESRFTGSKSLNAQVSSRQILLGGTLERAAF